jgi:hypothetical protein
MKDIDIYEAFNLLRLCDGVLLEGRLIEPCLIGIEEDPEHEFFYLSWSENVRGEIADIDVAFKEEDNQTVVIDGPFLTLINSDGEEEELTLLRSWDVEEDTFFEDIF